MVDWRTVTAFGLPFLLYLLTLAPTIYNLDSAELTTAAATGGLMRATCYPLYLFLGYFWTWLPLGDVGYRMNLFSAFNGALTIALAERILRRWYVGPAATFGALGLLASAPFFWAMSLIAEVYTLHTALMAGLILLLLHWADHPTPRRLVLIGLIIGLSLGHHGATVLLIPGCIWYIITVAPRQTLAPRTLLSVLAALLAGLSVYLYLPWRYGGGPVFNYAGHYDATGTFRPLDLRVPANLWWLVLGQNFWGSMLAYRGAQLWAEVGRFGVQLWQAFFAIGIGPGLLGLSLLLRRNWRLGGMLLLMFGCHAAFFIGYRVLDKDTMFLPTYLIWALWLGIGYQWLLDWVRHSEGSPLRPQWGARLLIGLMTGVVLLATAWNWPLVDLSNDWNARIQGETILRQVEPNALILGQWDTIPVIEYLQFVEGQRPDVQAINRFLIGHDDMVHLIEDTLPHRPVYIDRIPANLYQTLEVQPVGSFYRLRPQ
jgi:hypothetical protein